MPDYNAVPSAADFRRDSDVKLQQRGNDPVLIDIDDQLERYARIPRSDASKLFHATVELFLSCNGWIATAHSRQASTLEETARQVPDTGSNTVKRKLLKLLHLDNAKPKTKTVKGSDIVAVPTSSQGFRAAVDRKQFGAVLSLFGALEAELARLIGTEDRRKLNGDLTRIIGARVTQGGWDTDQTHQTRMLVSNNERMIHRLFFENGRILRYNVDVHGRPSELALLNSDLFDGADIMRLNLRTGVKEPGLSGYAPFVMSLDRQFYMTKHSIEQGGVFHSTYLNGQPVGAAGTMHVENGVLKAIRGDSGHYRPEPRQIANALRALQQNGISLAGVRVVHYDDADLTNDAASYSALPTAQAAYVTGDDPQAFQPAPGQRPPAQALPYAMSPGAGNTYAVASEENARAEALAATPAVYGSIADAKGFKPGIKPAAGKGKPTYGSIADARSFQAHQARVAGSSYAKTPEVSAQEFLQRYA